MSKISAKNERVKAKYFEYLAHAGRRAKVTIRQHERSILRLETHMKSSDFATYNSAIAVGFREALMKEEIGLSTVATTLRNLRQFLQWLHQQPGYKSKIVNTDIEYLHLSAKDERAASARVDKYFPSVKEVERILQRMPDTTETEKRNRALVAFLLLTAIRDGAMISLKRKHVDLTTLHVSQNPREVATKGSKRIDTTFFPVSQLAETIFLDYVRFLDEDLCFGPNDPLFPSTALRIDTDNCFASGVLSRRHWTNAEPVRAVLRKACDAVEARRFTPHRLRESIVADAYSRNLTLEEMKAISQNLGHENLTTSINSYGKLSLERQKALVRQSGKFNSDDTDDAEAVALLAMLKKIAKAGKS